MKLFITLITTGLVLCFSVQTYCQTITLGLAGLKDNTQGFRIAKKMMEVMGEKLKITIVVIRLPAIRAVYALKQNKIDGELSRVIEYEASIPGIIRVDEPITEMPYFAFSKSEDITINGWKSLVPYKVVYIRGYKMIGVHLKPIHTKLHPVTTAEMGLNMVAAGRADIYIDSLFGIASAMTPSQLTKKGIKKLKPPVMVVRTYTFFAPKHADLAKKYNKVLVELKKDGTYTKILTQTP